MGDRSVMIESSHVLSDNLLYTLFILDNRERGLY